MAALVSRGAQVGVSFAYLVLGAQLVWVGLDMGARFAPLLGAAPQGYVGDKVGVEVLALVYRDCGAASLLLGAALLLMGDSKLGLSLALVQLAAWAGALGRDQAELARLGATDRHMRALDNMLPALVAALLLCALGVVFSASKNDAKLLRSKSFLAKLILTASCLSEVPLALFELVDGPRAVAAVPGFSMAPFTAVGATALRMALTWRGSLVLSLCVLLSVIKPTRAGTFLAALLHGSHVANNAFGRERLVAASAAANAGVARAMADMLDAAALFHVVATGLLVLATVLGAAPPAPAAGSSAGSSSKKKQN